MQAPGVEAENGKVVDEVAGEIDQNDVLRPGKGDREAIGRMALERIEQHPAGFDLVMRLLFGNGVGHGLSRDVAIPAP